jgi:hypothetical protein
MEVKHGVTARGFDFVGFTDSKGNKCSIQKSSIATEDCIWFGLDEVEVVPSPNGFLNGRMHLSQEQVKALLPILRKFVKTGDRSCLQSCIDILVLIPCMSLQAATVRIWRSSDDFYETFHILPGALAGLNFAAECEGQSLQKMPP